MRNFFLVLGALLCAGCNFEAEVDEYCRETFNCEQAADGNFCVKVGHACQEGDCCEGLVCGPSGQCQGGGTLSLSASEHDFGSISFEATQRGEATLEVRNEGPLSASGFSAGLGRGSVSYGLDSAGLSSASQSESGGFRLDSSDCDSRSSLAVGERCSLKVSFGPTSYSSPGRYEETLRVENPAAAQVVTLKLIGGLGEPLTVDIVGVPPQDLEQRRAGVWAWSGSFQCWAPRCVGYYRQGEAVRVEPSLNTSALKFSGWTGACTGTTSSCSIVMDGPRELTATFSPAP